MILDKQTAIVLLEAGEPTGPDNVDAFLREVLSDPIAHPLPVLKRPFRKVIVEGLVAQKGEQYRQEFANIGVDSPLKRVCGGQADAIAGMLNCEGYTAMNHGEPSIENVVSLMGEEGMKRAVLVPMDPHAARHTTQALCRAFQDEWKKRGFSADSLVTLDEWGQEEAILKACALHYQETLSLLKEDAAMILIAKDPGEVVCKADSAVEKTVKAQFNTLCQLLDLDGVARLGWLTSQLTEPYCRPSVTDLIEEVANDGAKSIALVPFGWVADRFETLCGIDMTCARAVRQHKLPLYRVPSINDRPEFLVALANFISRSVGEPAV